jgi:hypothetical protein
VKDKIIEAMVNLIFFMIDIPNVVNNVEKFLHYLALCHTFEMLELREVLPKRSDIFETDCKSNAYK